MKREWSPDERARHSCWRPEERNLLGNKNGPTRLRVRRPAEILAAGRPIVSVQQLNALAEGAGLSLRDLDATTHDITARIDGVTRIKPLLTSLRNASDLPVPRSALATP